MKKYQIFSDFSDTIAKPSVGGKFPPFELELARLAGIDISAEYEHFLKCRRDESIPYEERILIWLKPFIGILSLKQIDMLVFTFSVNENFAKAMELLKELLHTKSLEITIVSGTIWQIVDCFLKSDKMSYFIKNNNISFNIGAVKLVFDNNGKFDGGLSVTDKLAYSSASSFPKDCLVIGDNAMEKFGFGEKLLNVQNYDPHLIIQRVEHNLNIFNYSSKT